GTALGGIDYTPVINHVVTFNPGETSKVISVEVHGDTAIEPNETFNVSLSNPSNAIIKTGTATGTILNDDAAPPVVVSIGNGAGIEGNSGTKTISFAVTLSAASTEAVSVLVSTVDGTATGGSDFAPFIGQMVSFAPGETSKLVTVEVLGDTMIEATETFTVLLSDPVNATIGSSPGMGAIVNDDVAAASSPREVIITEADGDQVFIKLSKGTLSLDDLDFMAVEGGVLVSKIDLTGKAAQLNGGKLTIEVVSPDGNGFANIGLIDATGIHLKKVDIQGDVTTLILGDPGMVGLKKSGTVKPAVKSLTVSSFGAGASQFPELTSGLSAPGIGKLNVQGSVADFSAAIGVGSGGGIDSMRVGGNIEGSTFNVGGIVGKVAIGDGMKDTTFSVKQSMKNLTVNRDIQNTELNVGTSLKGLAVGGSVIDSTIIASGDLNPKNAAKAKAFSVISVLGDLVRSQILAGYDAPDSGVNAGAGIGKIIVNGRFMASSIVAGVADATGDGFGRNDAMIAGANAVIAQIARITIKGAAMGTMDDDGDQFGITAQKIGKTKINGSKVPVTSGADNLALDTATGDVRLVEV
ncbi:MAG: Calx-beta domain-containing protein, partial [Chthoniobacteraceae bacterium]